MTLEFVAFCVLILLLIRWAIREVDAERQRDAIRKDLIATLHQVVDAQSEFRPMINNVAECIQRIERK